MAYEDHEIQRVFWGLDTNLLTAFPQESTELLPDYLYNDNPWDDVEYLYNKDVLFRQIVSMLYAFRWDPVPTVDDLFAWKNRYEWGPQAVMKVYGRPEPTPMMGSDIFSAETSANLQIILPYVQAHPETEFYFFIPLTASSFGIGFTGGARWKELFPPRKQPCRPWPSVTMSMSIIPVRKKK